MFTIKTTAQEVVNNNEKNLVIEEVKGIPTPLKHLKTVVVHGTRRVQAPTSTDVSTSMSCPLEKLSFVMQ